MGASKDCVCRNYSADKYTETNVVKLCAICICVFLPHQTGGLRFHTHTNTQLFVIIMKPRVSGFIRDWQCSHISLHERKANTHVFSI